MDIDLIRERKNPIVVPGLFEWRKATVFNPGIIKEGDKIYMYERTAGQLRPFICYIGMLESEDGINFVHSKNEPVFTPEMAGSKYGSVQDPRITKIGSTFYMTYAYRPFSWSSHPTGTGVPESFETEFPGFDGDPKKNMTRSGIAISQDLYSWEHYSWATPLELDDRDVMLFPEKIGGKFCVLRRPLQLVGEHHGTSKAGIWLSYSDDLVTWSSPELVAKPEFDWESNRIGGALPPIRVSEGWLVLYHGVETLDKRTRHVIYRTGTMILDYKNPTQVLYRCSKFFLQPEAYYEKFGLYIPDVVFPTGAYVDDLGLMHIYYGVCDTAIAKATVPLDQLVQFTKTHSK